VQPLFTAAEMRALDARAIGELGIPGTRLMEAAGTGAARLIIRQLGPVRGRRVAIVCGKGNNGGDGFVVARRLRAAGARVRVALVARRAEVRGDAAWALGRWRGPVLEIAAEPDLPGLARLLAGAEVIVDALLGTGVTGGARGLVAAAIEAINRAAGPAGPAPARTRRSPRPRTGVASGARSAPVVVALDLPSGLSADRGEIVEPVVRAALTATFAGRKRSLCLHPSAERAGRVEVIPIGVPEEEVARGIQTFLLEASDVRPWLRRRPADAHKGTYGHLLVVAGSVGRTGAAALAGRAAVRTGVGLCTIATPASQQPIVAALGMEPMTERLPETPRATLAREARAAVLRLAERTDALALGPGLSTDGETQDLVRDLVAEVRLPMVIDADGLNALAGRLEVVRGAPAPRLLTPHPGEMARLLGLTVPEVQADRIELVRRAAGQAGAWIVLKGAGSAIGAPDGRVYVNPTGNPAMATGGSGDVLTGMAGALLARRLEPLAALLCAVYLHGLAGDLAAEAIGGEGLAAGDIAEAIPRARATVAGA
jgi:NAD(P)H-hydrate epimerase